MGLKLFDYTELSSDFGDWIQTNCSNCDDNYNKIPDCFIDQEWSIGGTSEINDYWNNKQCTHCHHRVTGIDPYKRTTHWPPTYTITLDKLDTQDVQIKKYTSEYIKSKLCEYLGNFRDIQEIVTENGLFTYMNIIGKFIIEHFTFVSSPFSTQLLVIYTETASSTHATLPEVPQDSLPPDEEVSQDSGTRVVVHSKPISYYIENIFSNLKASLRKVQYKYTLTTYDSSGGIHPEALYIA